MELGDFFHGLHMAVDRKMQMFGYWGLEIHGNRQGAAPAFVNGGATDPSLLVVGKQAGSVVLAAKGAASQTANLQQWQDSAGVILTSIDSAGKLVFGPSGAQDTNLYRSAANTLKSDDAFEAVGVISGGSHLLLPAGAVAIGSSAYEPNARVRIEPLTAADKVLVLRGLASQVGDLQHWQNSAGTILTAIDKDGKLLFGPSGAQDTNLFRSAANTLQTNDHFRQDGSGLAEIDFYQKVTGQERQFYLKTDGTMGIWNMAGNPIIQWLADGTMTSKVTSTDQLAVRARDDNTNAGKEWAFYSQTAGRFDFWSATAGADAFRLETSSIADTETAMLVRRNVGGAYSLQRVSMDAVDTAGAGYRALRVPN
jgi:hypothetical protein